MAAGEALYLTSMTAIPRFRAAIDAKEHAERHPAEQSQVAQQTLGELLSGLERDARFRFKKLKDRCLEMRALAQGVRGRASGDGHGDRIRAPALDRMLWAFVRLLYSQQALERFLASTDEGELQRQNDELERRLEDAQGRGDERLINALTDSLATSELRLENYQKAERNAEFVDVELDRIEGKIHALSEMSVSHEDPDYISSQVDVVADSMTETEDAIRELNYITGLADAHEDAPSILEAELAEVEA